MRDYKDEREVGRLHFRFIACPWSELPLSRLCDGSILILQETPIVFVFVQYMSAPMLLFS